MKNLKPYTFSVNVLRKGTFWSGVSLLAILSGCTVGPNYQRPDVHLPKALIEQPNLALSQASSTAQQYVLQDIPTAWWQAFHSQELNLLIEKCLKNNPSVAIAQANLNQALENVKIQQAAFFPSVSATFNPTRQSVAKSLASPLASNSYVYNLHTAQLNASYSLDVWGANRRQVEMLKAEADASRYNVEVTYLTLISNVVNAAIQEAIIRDQIRITQNAIQKQRELTSIMHKARALGQVSDADVMTQESAQLAVEATLPPLQKQLAIQRDLIKALAGEYPSDRLAAEFNLAQFKLPYELPAALPSSLLQRRPDIRLSEAMLHAASANIGVVVANRLPDITLNADLGSSSNRLANLFASASNFWTIGANVAQPIFDGGALKHKEKLARAAYDGAVAQYKSTIIAAFQNVGDVMQSIQSDQNAYNTALQATQASSKSLNLARKQYRLGDISRIALLPLEQNDLQMQLALAQAQGNRLQDTAALFQALGGGWWSTQQNQEITK